MIYNLQTPKNSNFSRFVFYIFIYFYTKYYFHHVLIINTTIYPGDFFYLKTAVSKQMLTAVLYVFLIMKAVLLYKHILLLKLFKSGNIQTDHTIISQI